LTTSTLPLNGLRGHGGRRDRDVGVKTSRKLADLIEACDDETIPSEACEALAPLVVQLRISTKRSRGLSRRIAKMAQKDETARR
jgi:hypothetical protein